MDVIREHLMYKNSPLTICMSNITPQEQYEIIRIILESKTQQITVCKHNVTNKYIDILLDKLNIKIKNCLLEQQPHQRFDLHTVYNPDH
jgi:hypothetical protein